MHKAGFVNVVGNPNVGRPMLVSQSVGERISIATFKTQTTWHRIMRIMNTDDVQIVFSDTPGVLKPNYKMQEYMLVFFESTLVDADILLYITDVVENPGKNTGFLKKMRTMTILVISVISKVDVSSQKIVGQLAEKWRALLLNAEILPIPTANKFGIGMLLRRIQGLFPDSPPYFGKDQLTDKPAGFFTNEIICEEISLYYDKEMPYSIKVRIEQFKELAKQVHINAVIYVERESQKGTIIGHQSVTLKKASTEARKTLEKSFDKKVYPKTFVKVDKDWCSLQEKLSSFGYNSK